MFTKKSKKEPVSSTAGGSPNKLQPGFSSPRNTANSTSSTTFSLPSNGASTGSAVVPFPGTTSKLPISIRPQSSTEQYWAARALKAETLLSARLVHHRELKALSFSEETKRTSEIAAIIRAHDRKEARLEKIIIILLVCPVSLFLLTIYILTSPNRYHCQSPSSRWSLIPSHFTIPILSPFTSVVEHETSIIGTKSIIAFVMILAALIYFGFRYWLARESQVNSMTG